MMRGSGYAGSLGYIVPLCILSGILILRWDVVMYGKMKMKKEKKFARALGWLNLAGGIGLFAGNWLYGKLF